MSKNQITPGNMLTVAAPYTVLSGEGVLLGTSLFGVALGDALLAEIVDVETRGVWDLAADSDDTIAQYADVFYDPLAKVIRADAASDSAARVGVAMLAKGAGAVVCRVRLGWNAEAA